MITEAKFYLEKRKDKKTGQLMTSNVPILLFYSIGGKRLQYYTGLRVDSHLWDESAMRVIRKAENSAEINRELNRLKARAEEIQQQATVMGDELDLDEFKERMRGAKPKKAVKDFLDCLPEYLESSRLTKSANTIRSIKSGFNIIGEFAKDTRTRLSFKNINQAFYDSFLSYCFDEKKYGNGYTGKLIKDLKAFMNWATERGYNSNMDFNKKSFKKLTEEPEIIFLNYEELITLFNHDLKKNGRLEQVRDVFCFGCFTGMRFSDLEALAPEHIQNDYILYRVVKTGQVNTIPLNRYTRQILKKYEGKIPGCLPVISLVKTNAYLKELFGLVGLNRKVQQTKFRGAKRIADTSPLCEVITFHMSKKTFMTNFLAKGGSLLTAMAITGNKDFKTAKRYYKVVDSLKADEMQKVFGK